MTDHPACPNAPLPDDDELIEALQQGDADIVQPDPETHQRLMDALEVVEHNKRI